MQHIHYIGLRFVKKVLKYCSPVVDQSNLQGPCHVMRDVGYVILVKGLMLMNYKRLEGQLDFISKLIYLEILDQCVLYRHD